MFTSLESVLKLTYPNYEVLFAVQDERDPALDVVRMVLDKHPGANARIVVGESIGTQETDLRWQPQRRCQPENQQPY
jgi:cellulose synthase/poly-beta-1,6-N-acetylglucosamine synthase-like glycosyltransferase